MNWNRPSPRTSRALAPGVERIVRSASGSSVGPTDELTATIQSPLDERRASFVISMVDGWVERTEGWPYAWKVSLKGSTGRLEVHPNILLRLSRCLEGKVKYGGFSERSREDGPGSCPGRVATIPWGHRGNEEGSEGNVRSGASSSICLQRYTSADRAWSDD